MLNTISFLDASETRDYLMSPWKMRLCEKCHWPRLRPCDVTSLTQGLVTLQFEKLDYPLYFYGQVISLSDVALVWHSKRDASRFFIFPFFLSFIFFSVNTVTSLSARPTFLSWYTRRYWSPLGAPGKKDTIDNPHSSVTQYALGYSLGGVFEGRKGTGGNLSGAHTRGRYIGTPGKRRLRRTARDYRIRERDKERKEE